MAVDLRSSPSIDPAPRSAVLDRTRSVLYALIFVFMVSTSYLARHAMVLGRDGVHHAGVVRALSGLDGLTVDYVGASGAQTLQGTRYFWEHWTVGEPVQVLTAPEDASRAGVATFSQLWTPTLFSLGLLVATILALVVTRDRTEASRWPSPPKRAT